NANVGVTIGLTVTMKVVESAQIPAFGVNVYVAEFWLSTAEGYHVPAMPFTDIDGNAGTLSPAQIVRVDPKLNVGITFGVTVTVNEVVVSQFVPEGVKVYVPEFWSSTTAGFHTPFIPLVDV